MGNFYVNFSVQCADPKKVARAMKGRNAVVTPAANGWTVVCEEQTDLQMPEEIVELGEMLSRELQSVVLAVLNHDDDLLVCWLFQKGVLLGDYVSRGGDMATGGDTPEEFGRKLCDIIPGANLESVAAILRNGAVEDDESAYVFAMDRHIDLVNALALSQYSVGAGFNYLSDGDLPDGLEEEQLIRTE